MRKACLIGIAAIFAVVSSCVNPTRELSSYWDGYDFSSIDGFDDIDAAEEKFDGFISLLNRVSFEEASQAMVTFMDSARLNEVGYMVWASWFETYLHATVSPYRNDDLFAVWIDQVFEDGILDDHTMRHLSQIKKTMGLNVVGQPAADVVLAYTDSTTCRISDMKGQRTLLLLLDANCPSCLEYLTENLKEYGRKDIRLVAVLVNGSPALFRNIASRLPEDVVESWELFYCPGREIEKGDVFDLTLVPSRIMLTEEGIIEKLYY